MVVNQTASDLPEGILHLNMTSLTETAILQGFIINKVYSKWRKIETKQYMHDKFKYVLFMFLYYGFCNRFTN